MKHKAILFLEPGNAMLNLVDAAKKRGYTTIVVSMSPESLGKTRAPYDQLLPSSDQVVAISDWRDECDLTDKVEVIENDFDIVGVYGAVENAKLFESRLRQRLDLPYTSTATLEIILDKFQLRKKLIDAGLSALQIIDGVDVSVEDPWPFANGAFFKPKKGHASLGVKRCRNFKEWNELVDSRAARTWHNSYVNREAGYFLESEHEGELLSVELLVDRRQSHIIGLLGRNLYSANPVIELGSKFPHRHPFEEEIRRYADDVLRTVEYVHGPVHMELIVSPDGHVELIDLNPRFVGADVMLSINLAYQINIADYVLDLCLGAPLGATDFETKAFCNIQSFFFPKEVASLGAIHFPENPRLALASCRHAIASSIPNGRGEHHVAGCILVVDESMDAAERTTQHILDQIRINERHRVEI